MCGEFDEMKGGGYVAPISREFGSSEAEELCEILNSGNFAEELATYSCGKALPRYRFGVGLYEEGASTERHVAYSSEPTVGQSDEPPCVQKGMYFLWNKAVRSLDRGEPINYHYKNPLTGEEYPPEEFRVPPEPHCLCDQEQSEATEEDSRQ